MSDAETVDRPVASRRRDAGATPVAVILLLGILVAVFAGLITALAAIASDEASSATHAADAAALGGAQGVLEAVPASLALGFTTPTSIAELVGGGTCLQTGRAKASELATANGATLTTYCYDVFDDEVSVAVRMNTTNVDGPPADAKATAETTFAADECRLDPGFDTPSEDPGDSEDSGDGAKDDDEPPAPPTPLTTWIDCGLGHQAVQFRPEVNRFFFVRLADDLEDAEPRLTA